MPERLLTTIEAARLLGVKEWQIRYVLRAGRVRRPIRTASGNFLWSEAEIRDLARALEVPVPGSGEDPEPNVDSQAAVRR